MERRAKIIATLGPASQDKKTIKNLLMSGMDVARINFSHGSHQDHTKAIKTLRETAQELNHPVTILQDLSGPKIRTGEIAKGTITLKKGDPLTLTTADVPGKDYLVSVNYKNFPQTVKKGNRILLDDGKLELITTSVEKEQVITEVLQGGILKPRKGVNLPGVDVNLQALTDKDLDDLAFGLSQEIDVLALSYVREAKDIKRLRQAVQSKNPERSGLPIIAKLEHPDAINNLHEIIHEADGVMVARGDLGIEMPPEEVPIIQKRIVAMANKYLKFVIIATQMLESMVNNPRPTRAEASDVANAILDGTDAVMLSGETAIGKFPEETVQMMSSIILQSEEHIDEWGRTYINSSDDTYHDDAVSITRAAAELAHDRAVAAIAVFTRSGRTARLMSKARPCVPILAFTPVERTYRFLPMLWGIKPVLIPQADSIEEMIGHVDSAVIEGTPVKPGQEIVLIAGFPIHKMVPPNLALIHTIQSQK